MWESVWIAGRFAVGHCTASHCIGLYRDITLKWSEFALIYRDEEGGKRDAGRWSKSKTRICRKKAVPLLLCKLLALFFFLSSKCSSSLFVSFLLIVARCCFSWSMNTARNGRCVRTCVNVTLHVLYVLLLTIIYAVMLLTAVRCYVVLLVQKSNQIPCTGCYGNRKQIQIYV